MTTKFDREGNIIGDGTFHADYAVLDLSSYGVLSEVSKSDNSESVYIIYSCASTRKAITVRFSNHNNNAVKFGDQLNGYITTADEILYRLGLKKAVFVPDTYLYIPSQMVAKKNLRNYEEADLTIQEMYALGRDADISMYKGKIAKGGNYLILGDTVKEYERKGRDAFGREVVIGNYIYID